MSRTQMSPGPPFANATYLLSGDNSGPRNSASAPAASIRPPLAPYHTSSELPPEVVKLLLALVRYVSVPVVDSEKGYVNRAGGANGSATGNGAPVTSRRLTSNGCAISAPSRMNTTWPVDEYFASA